MGNPDPSEYEKQELWRSDLRAFRSSAKDHWKELVGGSTVAVVASYLGTVGFNAPPWFALITGAIFAVVFAAFLAFRDGRRDHEKATGEKDKEIARLNGIIEKLNEHIPELIPANPRMFTVPEGEMLRFDLENIGKEFARGFCVRAITFCGAEMAFYSEDETTITDDLQPGGKYDAGLIYTPRRNTLAGSPTLPGLPLFVVLVIAHTARKTGKRISQVPKYLRWDGDNSTNKERMLGAATFPQYQTLVARMVARGWKAENITLK
jgi:hypothetical protein